MFRPVPPQTGVEDLVVSKGTESDNAKTLKGVRENVKLYGMRWCHTEEWVRLPMSFRWQKSGHRVSGCQDIKSQTRSDTPSAGRTTS